MKRNVLLMAALCMTAAANAGVTTHLKLDCRTGVRAPSPGGEMLCYDASWYDGGSECRITDNGTVIATGTAGSYNWQPEPSYLTQRLLKLEILSNGQVVGTETAQFEMDSRIAISNFNAAAVSVWDKAVLNFDVVGVLPDDATNFWLEVVASNCMAHAVISARSISGATNLTAGTHAVIWDWIQEGLSSWQNADVALKCVYHYRNVEDGMSDVVCATAWRSVRLFSSSSSPSFSVKGLVHRWSFNGELTDSVGRQSATIVGNVTTDGSKYKTPGGSSGTAYIDLGDWILPTNGLPATIEMWVTSNGSSGWQRFFEFGSMPAGYNFASGDTGCYTTDSISMCCNGSCTGGRSGTMGSYVSGTEYHLAAVLEKNGNTGWSATYYKQNAITGATEKKYTVAIDAAHWPGMKQTEMLLGQALTCWDSVANASYNELRIWNRSMTEEELSQNVLDGADAYLATAIYPMNIHYSPVGTNGVQVLIDDKVVVTDDKAGVFCWDPEEHGDHVVVLRSGDIEMLQAVEVPGKYICSKEGHAGGVIAQPAVEPTSGADGRMAEIRCSRCGAIIQAAEVIPALGYVRNVTARQLWPHKKVEVCYTLADDIGDIAGSNDEVVVSCSNGRIAVHVLGDCACTPGSHCVVWDMETDGILDESAGLSFRVSVQNATPGFVAKAFSSPSLRFDKTSDVWAAPVLYVSDPEGLYVTSLAEHTTMAYGCYMWMVGGITYSFKGRYDDFVGVKVGSDWIMGNSSECSEASGSYTPSASGYYPVEFRVGNNSGGGGIQNSTQYGIKWCSSADTTWRNVENTATDTVFFLNRTDGEFAAWRTGTSPIVPVNLSSAVKDGMEVTNVVELGYSPIDAGSVAVEINGHNVLSATESGTFVWSPERPGTYVHTHLAGTNVFTRTVIYRGTDDAKELEIGWLDGPVSNLFPNSYASVTNVVIAPTVTRLSEGAFAGCVGLGSGVVIRDGCVLGVNGTCPEHVVLPEGTRLIADGAFRNCNTLTRIVIPEGVKAVGAGTFANCTELEKIVIPEGVEEIGDGAFENCTWMQQVEFPSSLTNIGKFAFANCTMLEGVECFDGLQAVGECAFSNCWRMLSVALPASVDEIGAGAFHNCKNVLGVTVPTHVDTIANLFPDVYQKIQSVAIAEGETELVASVFSGCKLLEEVELSDFIEEIPDSTFEGCAELRRIKFPSELIRIGNRAFYGCGQVWQLEFPDGLEEIGDDAFNGVQQVRDLACPASVKRIGARAFKGVWNDEEVKLPVGLEALGADAFANCPSVRRIALPAVATPIKSAFPAAYAQINSVKILGAPEVMPSGFCRDVAQLAGVQIPASVTNIGEYAFAGLSNLAEIELPPNLRTIGQYAFSGDGRIVTIALPQSVESVGYRAFYGCGNVRVVSCSGELGTLSTLFPSAYSQITTVSINAGTSRLMDDLLSGCSKLSEIDIPPGVTNFGARVFKNCTALAAFGVPNGVVSIGSEVFMGCTGLMSLSLPEGLAEIPSWAFGNCSAISSIVIPASVTYIGANAFSGCSALTSISYLGSCPAFDSGCYNGTPAGLSSYVVFGSRGWDGVPTSKALPEYWPTANARAITYWEPNTFEATFNGNGGTPSSSVVVQTTGMTYALPENDLEMTGARFDGWWTQPVNGGRIKTTTKVEVVGAQTFYAHWKYNDYAVRFDANGGIGEMADQALTVNAAAELAANRFVRKDHRFAGWSLSADGEAEYADGAEVENLSLEQGAVVTLYAVWEEQAWTAADYLNVPGLAVAFEGDADWSADNEVSHDGIGSMRSGAIPQAGEGLRTTSIMRTAVVGEGSGSFWWKADCEPNDGDDYYDYCVFCVDGVEVAKIAGATEWEKVDYEVSGEGEHILAWTFTRDDWDEDESLYENAAWVDEFRWTPTPVTLSFDGGGAEGVVPSSITKSAGCEVSLPTPSLLTKSGMVFVGWTDGDDVFAPGDVYRFGSSDAVLTAVWEEKVWTLEEAANLTGYTLLTGGAADWVVDLVTNYDGVASIRSGLIGDSKETWVSLAVNGPGVIGFRVSVSGEFNRGKMCDYLKFEIDGTTVFASHDVTWSNVVAAVEGVGAHVLKWTYLKNASKSAGYDGAWIDEIVWTPNETPADPIPEIVDPTPEQIAEVLQEAKDPKLAECITNETDYTAFRDWAGKVKGTNGTETAGTQAVKESSNAWVSFALGSETLLEEPPTDEDLTVEEFVPSAEAGKFDFTVSVEDVEVGSEASKENLKKVFGLEGAVSLTPDGFSSDNVDIDFSEPANGKVKFTAGPKDASAETFFMKVKINP